MTVIIDTPAQIAMGSRSAVGRFFPRRRAIPLVWVASFLALLAVLVFKNRHLFGQPIYEDGDFAANSILIAQAKNFELLVGNYSRIGFWHPGPIFLYIQAFGEWVFHDVLRVVPTPFNAHMLAILICNSALVSIVVGIIYSWTHWIVPAGAALIVCVLFAATHPHMLISTWMPYVYVGPFLLFVVACASVAAGRVSDLWAVTLAGGMLIHGHVAFGLFVIVIGTGTLLSLRFVRREPEKRILRRHPQSVGVSLGILLLFTTPVVLHTILEWPGQIPKYWNYVSSDSSGGHAVTDALQYNEQFWSISGGGGWLIVGGLFASATIGALFHPVHATRPFLLALVAASALGLVLMVAYTIVGVDGLDERFAYVGYFSWGLPLVLLLVVTITSSSLLPNTNSITAISTIIGLIVMSIVLVSPALHSDSYRGQPQLPSTIRVLTRGLEPRQALVIQMSDKGLWPDVMGLLVGAERMGVDTCIADAWWTFMATDQQICPADDMQSGRIIEFSPKTSQEQVVEGAEIGNSNIKLLRV
jgi:hypothetical protein